MTTNLLDHVQAVRSAYEAANSRDSFVGRWRITPVPSANRQPDDGRLLFLGPQVWSWARDAAMNDGPWQDLDPVEQMILLHDKIRCWVR
jgi:hypothetical protein